MQLLNKFHLIVLILILVFIVSIAGGIDSKDKMSKGVLWSKQ